MNSNGSYSECTDFVLSLLLDSQWLESNFLCVLTHLPNKVDFENLQG